MIITQCTGNKSAQGGDITRELATVGGLAGPLLQEIRLDGGSVEVNTEIRRGLAC